MGVIIILFFIATILAFAMLYFRAWEIKTTQIEYSPSTKDIVPKIYFRNIEKILMHLAKYVIQWAVLITVKYSFIIYTKTKDWVVRNWPKVYRIFKKTEDDQPNKKYSFVQRAILELKMKIRHTKEKVRREHEEQVNGQENI